MGRKMYLYPKWVRIWHLANALLCLALIVSGISMQYAGEGFSLLDFECAVTLHNISGVTITLLYVVFVILNRITSNRIHYKFDTRGAWQRITAQARYYMFGIFKGSKAPFPVSEQMKFNPLQQITYILIMYIAVPVVIITGWALLYPEITFEKVFGQSGLLLTDQLHIIMGFFVSVFLVVHIYFATIGHSPGANFKSIASGWHETHD